MDLGQFLAILGASCAMIFAGMGSAKGVGIVGQAAAGAVSENPSLFGKLIPLEALPGSQGIYGFLIAFIILLKLNIFGGTLAEVSMLNGLIILGASLAVGVVGYFSAIHQGRVAAAGVQLVAKDASQSGRAITMTVFVETYAVLAFIISFLAVFFLNLG